VCSRYVQINEDDVNISLIYGRPLLNFNEDEFDCFERTAEIFGYLK